MPEDSQIISQFRIESVHTTERAKNRRAVNPLGPQWPALAGVRQGIALHRVIFINRAMIVLWPGDGNRLMCNVGRVRVFSGPGTQDWCVAVGN